MKANILDSRKWMEKTAQVVRHRCATKEGIPIGMALCFFDPMTTDPDKQWSFSVDLAYDPHSGISEEDKKRVEDALTYIMAGVQRIFMGVDAVGEVN
jgi:hypothetical protein